MSTFSISNYSFAIVVPLAILALLVAVAILRRIAWWFFSFDDDVRSIMSQKKSSEVRLGKIAETLSPLLDEFPIDVKKAGTSTIFVGQPVDFIHFDPDEGITFIEVKSGNSRLSESQRRLKSLVKSGKVSWVDLRVR